MPLQIALDMDDTLAATLEYVFGTYMLPPPKTWVFYDTGSVPYGKFMRDVKGAWLGHWDEIMPTEPGQAAVVRRLMGMGRVDIVTVGFAGPKSEWLKMHGIPYDEIVTVSDGRDKAKLDYDVYVDDSPVNFQAFSEAGKPCILYDAPHNLDVGAKYRARSLGEAADVLRKILG